MEIATIKSVFENIKANTPELTSIKIDTVAKELGVKPTQLKWFIGRNNKLFHTVTCKYGTPEEKGMFIINVFEKAEDNPATIEHALVLKKKYEKTVWLEPVFNCGIRVGYMVRETKTGGYYDVNNYIWKNTASKIDSLIKDGIIGTFTVKGYLSGAPLVFTNAVKISNPDKVVKYFVDKGWDVLFTRI